MQPEQIISQQKEWIKKHAQTQETVLLEEVFLHLAIDQSEFLLPIFEVSEVSEMLPIRHYPAQVPGHLGVINLRGKVIPVMSLEHLHCQSQIQSNSRLVIIQNELDEYFAIIATNVRKVSLHCKDRVEILSLDNKPVRVLNRSTILQVEDLQK